MVGCERVRRQQRARFDAALTITFGDWILLLFLYLIWFDFLGRRFFFYMCSCCDRMCCPVRSEFATVRYSSQMKTKRKRTRYFCTQQCTETHQHTHTHTGKHSQRQRHARGRSSSCSELQSSVTFMHVAALVCVSANASALADRLRACVCVPERERVREATTASAAWLTFAFALKRAHCNRNATLREQQKRERQCTKPFNRPASEHNENAYKIYKAWCE